jgi:hypothetical protein
MVLAAAMISLAVLAPQAGPQPAPPDNGKPYSVEGVRKAAAPGPTPTIDTSSIERDERGYRMGIEYSAAISDPCGWIVTPFRPSWCGPVWTGVTYPTWHDQFVAMTGPDNYSVPFSPMSNGQRLQAVASNVAFGLAIGAITSLIHDQIVRTSYAKKQKKVQKVRDQIELELQELARLNETPPQADPVIKK